MFAPNIRLLPISAHGHLQSAKKSVDKFHTFTLLNPYFVTVIPFCPPDLAFMLFGNCCDLELQTSNVEWGSGVFSTVYCTVKRVMLLGQVNKNPHVSRPRPLYFLAPPLIFLLFFMSNVFMSENQQASLYLVLSSPLSHTKKTQNRELSAYYCCVHTKIM